MSIVHAKRGAIALALGAILITAAGVAGTMTFRGPDEVDLPPTEQRVIVGTWLEWIGSTTCTKRIEKVKTKLYMVLRCADGSGGKTGNELVKVSATKFRPKAASRYGDYYVIFAGGELGVYDTQGPIATLPKHPRLWP